MKVFQKITNEANTQLKRCGCTEVSEAQSLAVLEAYRKHTYVDLHIEAKEEIPSYFDLPVTTTESQAGLYASRKEIPGDCQEGNHEWKETGTDAESGSSDMECVKCGESKTVFMAG